MSWVDYAIVAVVAISALISLFRGFVKEAISLLGWVLAFWVAVTFTHWGSSWLLPYIDAPSLRMGAAFMGLFVGVLIVTAAINYLASILVDKTGLSGTDRVLGMVFGAARGAVVVAGLVLLAGVTAMPQDPWWQDSLLIPYFQVLATEIRELLPPEIAQHFKF